MILVDNLHTAVFRWNFQHIDHIPQGRCLVELLTVALVEIVYVKEDLDSFKSQLKPFVGNESIVPSLLISALDRMTFSYFNKLLI